MVYSYINIVALNILNCEDVDFGHVFSTMIEFSLTADSNGGSIIFQEEDVRLSSWGLEGLSKVGYGK